MRAASCNRDEVQGHAACVVAGTLGGIYRMVKGRWGDDLFSHRLTNATFYYGQV